MISEGIINQMVKETTILVIVAFVFGLIVGASIYFYLCGSTTHAYDPCDLGSKWEQDYNKLHPKSNTYDPNDDPASYFHWYDGQPSLHVK